MKNYTPGLIELNIYRRREFASMHCYETLKIPALIENENFKGFHNFENLLKSLEY